ncbi:hypothetical protein VKT23_015684 [Stygiomarasmius scandens]|uniref:Uncharacterized protein n=1 Tax=Marasmiellus scandens TaxID=2682957 RepID=A0ABR1IZU2_9AGAR
MPDSPRTPQEQLSSYFARSASSVHLYADRFEHEYARPALNTSNVFFNEHPILTVFLSILTLLSLLPAALFVIFSAAAILTFTILAICFVISSSVMVVLFFLFLLTCTLIIIFCVSGFLTGSVFFVYTSYRLFVLLRSQGVKGIHIWGSETISYVWPLRLPSLTSYSNTKRRPTRTGPTSSYSLDDRKPESDSSHDSSHSKASSDAPVIVDEKDASLSEHSRNPSAESGSTADVKREEE